MSRRLAFGKLSDAAGATPRGVGLLLVTLACAALCASPHGYADAQADIADTARAANIESSLFRVSAKRSNGDEQFGSAVLIAADRLVTNCHVTREAGTIEVARGAQRWNAQLRSADIEHDLCVLDAFGAGGRTPQLAGSAELEIGHAVYAAGYPPAAQLSIRGGEVLALYDYDGARVIRTNAWFDPGQSGGGLFDAGGRLVGILTFKSARDGTFHFALPLEWLRTLAPAANAARAPRLAFWERGTKEQPPFLRAAALEIAQDWGALLTLGRQWSQDESGNPEAWVARGKAAHHNKRGLFEAAAAFRQATKLNPQHRFARQRLDTLERNLGCTHYGWCPTSAHRYQ
jgi:serine protease Do